MRSPSACAQVRAPPGSQETNHEDCSNPDTLRNINKLVIMGVTGLHCCTRLVSVSAEKLHQQQREREREGVRLRQKEVLIPENRGAPHKQYCVMNTETQGYLGVQSTRQD